MSCVIAAVMPDLFSVVAVAILAAKDSASSADTDGFTAGM